MENNYDNNQNYDMNQQNQSYDMNQQNQNINYQPIQPQQDPNTCVMTIKDWIITLVVSAIPCVGIVMLFVWAFGEGNENRKNFCKAYLIFTVVLFVLMMILYVGFFAAIFSAARNSAFYMFM